MIPPGECDPRDPARFRPHGFFDLAGEGAARRDPVARGPDRVDEARAKTIGSDQHPDLILFGQAVAAKGLAAARDRQQRKRVPRQRAADARRGPRQAKARAHAPLLAMLLREFVPIKPAPPPTPPLDPGTERNLHHYTP